MACVRDRSTAFLCQSQKLQPPYRPALRMALRVADRRQIEILRLISRKVLAQLFSNSGKSLRRDNGGQAQNPLHKQLFTERNPSFDYCQACMVRMRMMGSGLIHCSESRDDEDARTRRCYALADRSRCGRHCVCGRRRAFGVRARASARHADGPLGQCGKWAARMK